MRGADCPYEHSDDALMPGPEMMFPPFPFPGPQMNRGRGRGRGRGGMNGHSNGFPGSGPGPNPFGIPFPMLGAPPPLSQGPRVRPDSQWGATNKPPPDRSSTTLVITEVPVQHLSVPAIREYFSKFGEVTNVGIEAPTKRALVSFTSNAEAYAAWRSDEAIFGSRHVRVMWHRPHSGQGGAGQKALDASAGLISNLKKMEEGVTPQEAPAVLWGPEQRLRATLAELEAKERRNKRETLMAEQKVLLKRAEGAEREEKIEILKRLRGVAKEVEDLEKPVEVDVEMGDKERLDQELGKYGMDTPGARDEAELLKLNAQLSALRDKVRVYRGLKDAR